MAAVIIRRGIIQAKLFCAYATKSAVESIGINVPPIATLCGGLKIRMAAEP